MKIALLGADGQLSFDLKRTLKAHELVSITRADFDVTDVCSARDHLSELCPDVIINTTAYHRVDICESAPDIAFGVNAVAVFQLASIARELDALFVHISTDYVFDGRQSVPYTERSEVSPLSVYASSKLSGEHLVRSVSEEHLLIRTCGLYGVAGSAGKGGNFVETMIRKARKGESIRVVSDQIVGPTATLDLARQIGLLLDTNEHGLFHVSAEGSCSWFDFAAAIFELTGIDASLEPTTKEFHKTAATRPAFSVLENARLKELGLNRMRHWRKGLIDYLQEKHGI